MIELAEYSDVLRERFNNEEKRIRIFIPDSATIEHVGSSAVGIGGKNIVDILIGASDRNEMKIIRDILINNGYREGNDTYDDRIFLASREGETREGDFHIHICPILSNTYKDFIILRDFLINNPGRAKEYFEKKYEFAREANFDRKKYKALKSKYVSKLLHDAKTEL